MSRRLPGLQLGALGVVMAWVTGTPGALGAESGRIGMAGNSAMGHDMGFFAGIAAKVDAIIDMLRNILASIPDLPAELSRVASAIASTTPAGIHPALHLALGLAIAALVIILPSLLDFLAIDWLRHRMKVETRLGRALRLMALDVMGFLLAVAIAFLLVHLLFKRELMAGMFAVTLVGAAVRWRLTMLVPEILLRPGHREFRLVRIDCAKAKLITRLAGAVLALGILFVTVVPVLLEAGLPERSAQAIALIVGTLMAVCSSYGLHRILAGAHPYANAAGQFVILLVWVAWSAGVTMLNFEIYQGLVWSMAIIAATFGFDRLLGLASHQADSGVAEPSSKRRQLIVATLRRVVLAVAGTVVAGLVARLWLVDILGIVSHETWVQVREAIITAVGVLVAGYIAYEVLRAWTQAKFGHQYTTAFPGADDESTPASRLSSVLPVLQGALGVFIIATALLLALSHLGINIAPLIAGAGIFGLALSFGSQALVRDIVAGLFYMFDDAFRVGEYIEAGKHKGTVERIALRSVRLRHQNGQFHTLPYGQLGAVTNYSRDYSTVKFNLRLTRDVDVDKVRKLAKRLGQELLQDEEIGKEFIQPLKLQGLADVQENALVCRFKFTARPAKPTVVQRIVLNRLYRVLVQNGITFASNAVVVQVPPGVSPEAAAAAVRGAAAAATGTPGAPADRNGLPPPQR